MVVDVDAWLTLSGFVVDSSDVVSAGVDVVSAIVDVVSARVDELNGGTNVNVVCEMVDCREVVWTVVVCKGVVVGNGTVEKEPMVCDVVRTGVVDVCRIKEDVLVVDAKVKSLPTHSCRIRLPRCASCSSSSESVSASTSWHWSSTLFSICLIPAIQEREQLCPLVKSAVVQL